MSGGILAPYRWQMFYNGSPASGAKLYSFLSGTSTPQALYSDSSLSTPYNPQPVEADSNGVFPIMYMADVAYRITITTSTGVSIFTATDNIFSLSYPVTVPHGGTGVATLTSHGVIVGNGTGVLQATSAGTSGQVLTSNGAAADPTFQATSVPVGGILQVVSATYATETDTTSSTYSTTGLTAAITPASTSNKVLVLVSQNGCQNRNAAATSLRVRLIRGVTNIGDLALAIGAGIGANTLDVGSVSGMVLDSPASVAAQTYVTHFSSSDNASTVRVQNNASRSTIVLMEVKG